jgi:hypothetical protein
LYMLYLAELLNQDPRLRFRYADDICPITAVPKAGQDLALRWLRVWFNRRLKFRRHVSKRTTKARQVA